MKIPAFFGCLTAVVLLSNCGHKSAAADEGDDAAKPVTAVTVAAPVSQDFLEYIELNGNTTFQRRSEIRANITGYLESMPWKVGNYISSGALFCTIKTKEQEALKNIDAREPSLRQFQTPLSVRAGAPGNITAINFSRGDFVNEGDILATVTDPSSLVLVVNVPYEYHDLVTVGKACIVRFPDGRTLASAISGEVPYVDSASQTQSFLIRMPGNNTLPENMNLIVRIVKNQAAGSMALPLDAIQTNEEQTQFWVMKLVNDSLAIKNPVTVGLKNDSLRQIVSGLSYSDRVIVTGAYGLDDSARVKVDR